MDIAQKYQACVEATGAFVRGCGFTDVVVGLSGGIDSTLVAAMAVDALGAEHVHGVLMPGPYSTGHSVDDALEFAQMVGIDAQTISIAGPYEAFASILQEPCGEAFSGVTSQNIQARSRMVVVMALSNAHGWLMLNTGNKSEVYTGYSTLYGDMAGGFAPIGGLYKTDVFAACRWRNGEEAAKLYGFAPAIPEHVIVKPPSAELAPDQQDESSLGIDYATLDRILEAHVDGGLDEEALVGLAEGPEATDLSHAFTPDQVRLVCKKVRGCAFKRPYEPPCPDVKFY